MTAAISWLARTAGLVLALLATLSIMGSIAAIPSGATGEGPTRSAERSTPVATAAAPLPAEAAANLDMPQPDMPQPDVRADRGQVVVTTVPPRPPDPLLWLEPLTYAVQALAGLAAVIALLLWRVLARLGPR